jgi:hypothetical protein
MAQPLPDTLTPIWITLHKAIARHIDDADREEFLDTVVTIANRDDALKGAGAGDAYLARVIQSLTGGDIDTNDPREP